MQTFIARQPILDRQKKAFAYEILCRPHVEGASELSDIDQEFAQVVTDIGTFLELKHLRQGRKAFVKTPPDLLLSGHLSRLSKELAIIKIVDLIEPTREIVAACEMFKRSGYSIAVQVLSDHKELEPLIELADFVNVDLLSTRTDTQVQLPQRYAKGKHFISERVENEAAFRHAQEMGYEYYQGSFLNRPVNLGLKSIPSLKLHYLQLIQEVNKPDFDFNKLEGIIKQDLSLSFNLLRYINSALFGTAREIQSIRQALALLGEMAVRKWVSLVALTQMSQDKSEELLIQAAVRGKFCESIAPAVRLGHRREELFLMGMFSLLDAILDRSINETLSEIPLAADIKDALTGVTNELHEVYQYAMAYEDGDWHRVWTYGARLVTDEALLPKLYIDSVSWVEENLRCVSPGTKTR